MRTRDKIIAYTLAAVFGLCLCMAVWAGWRVAQLIGGL